MDKVVNENFERLKREMNAKKEQAINKSDSDRNNTSGITNDINNDSNVNKNSDVNKNNIVNKNVYKDTNKNVNVTENVDDDYIDVSDNIVNKFVIKKEKIDEDEELKRGTYYLKKKTIRKINQTATAAGVSKYELVQMLLDYAFSHLEIQE